MARSIAMDDGAPVYRAVTTITTRDGQTITRVEGPYASIGAARARVTFWVNHLTDPDTGTSRAHGHVERGTVRWEPVE